jgi:uncharacterized protein (DUF2236 family)
VSVARPAPRHPGFTSAFADGSPIRRVHGESILLLGGGRALLMQVAHPAVAMGVERHSDFRVHGYRRLLRTLRLLMATVFGDKDQVRRALEAIDHAHANVKGPGYDANEPQLKLWVWATIVDTAFVMHRLLVGPLEGEAAVAYYVDAKRLALMFGVPSDLVPPSLAGFEAYVTRMVSRLEVSEDGRAICRDLFRPWPLMLPMRELSSGLLPPSLREQFVLGWGPRRQRALDLLAMLSRRVWPRLPRRLRAPPWFLMP